MAFEGRGTRTLVFVGLVLSTESVLELRATLLDHVDRRAHALQLVGKPSALSFNVLLRHLGRLHCHQLSSAHRRAIPLRLCPWLDLWSALLLLALGKSHPLSSSVFGFALWDLDLEGRDGDIVLDQGVVDFTKPMETVDDLVP